MLRWNRNPSGQRIHITLPQLRVMSNRNKALTRQLTKCKQEITGVVLLSVQRNTHKTKTTSFNIW
jgi:hypothetical protein